MGDSSPKTLPTAAELKAAADQSSLAAEPSSVAQIDAEAEDVHVSVSLSPALPPPVLQPSSAQPSPEPTAQSAEPPKQLQPKSQGWSGFGGLASSWGSIMETVKKQSESVVSVYKRDLAEFANVVQAESSVLAQTASKLAQNTLSAAAKTVNALDTQLEALENQLGALPSKLMSQDRAAAPEGAASADDQQQQQAQQEEQPEFDDYDVSTGLLIPRFKNKPEFETYIDRKLDEMHLEERIEQIEALAGEGLHKAEDLVGKLGSSITTLLKNPPRLKKKASSSQNKHKNVVAYNRKAAQLSSLRRDPQTYITNPHEPISTGSPFERDVAERFGKFQQSFDLAAQAEAISISLSQDPGQKQLMDEIVPTKVSYDDFWLRYFWKIAELEREEETRRRLMSDVEAGEEDFKWDSDEDEEEEEEEVVLTAVPTEHAEAQVPITKVQVQQVELVSADHPAAIVPPSAESARASASSPEQNSDKESFEIVTESLKFVKEMEGTVGAPQAADAEEDWGDWE
ncbi:uncharacterized protein BJ171DRAFT_492329 [Polychytrium aggregatum]|uniref:uncharacterized protein n=1 Tax=Polychytrium aggregatum TaxID=110093 RepID=UPI0022FE80AE|nr:uncharacterized protein BJ171DRAFT_492329 [Polychytrium aggregatum]KAI9207998.1 hypothetical protein BJ171DRAFT_492329 [Polychytrium aggregatum]